MARNLYKITERGLSKLPEGNHSDGGNLFIRVRCAGPVKHFFWNLRYKSPVTGRTREMGLGPHGIVSLQEAREMALEYRRQLHRGLDPLEERQKEKAKRQELAGKSFQDVTKQYIEVQTPKWKDARGPATFLSTLQHYAFPIIGRKPVAAISQEDILAILEPIWSVKTETAKRIRHRIEHVIDYATAMHWREGDNPARWNGPLSHILPSPTQLIKGKKTSHFALTPDQLKASMNNLCKAGGVSAFAVRFCAFTVVRSSEVRNMLWDEIDVSNRVWVIPARRMKAGKEHRVPLSQKAMDILEEVRPLRTYKADALVFPNHKQKPLSDVALSKALKIASYPIIGNNHATIHGVRSTFRDWVSEETRHDRDAAELALAHTVGNAVERAYRRGDMFEKRRVLMEDWASKIYR